MLNVELQETVNVLRNEIKVEHMLPDLLYFDGNISKVMAAHYQDSKTKLKEKEQIVEKVKDLTLCLEEFKSEEHQKKNDAVTFNILTNGLAKA